MTTNIKNLKDTVAYLARTHGPFRNCANVEFLEEISIYLKNKFIEYGYDPEMQSYRVQMPDEISEHYSAQEIEKMRAYEYKNVIASYNPTAKRRLIVSAHYDVHGNQPGADDNASAVAGLLEVARLLNEEKPDLDYRVDFLACNLEEWPFHVTEFMGSRIHAKSMIENNVDVIGNINFEMIGCFHDGDQPYPEIQGISLESRYPKKANFLMLAGHHKYNAFNKKVLELMQQQDQIVVCMIDDPVPEIEMLASLSDHESYWEVGIPALMATDTAFIRNPNYHQATDTIETLNFPKMADSIYAVYLAVKGFTGKEVFA